MHLDTDRAMFTVTQGTGPLFLVRVKLTSPAFDISITEDERRADFAAKVWKVLIRNNNFNPGRDRDF